MSKKLPQKTRSTVGTVTEIYDYLRLLFARAGTPYSPATGLPIEAQQVQEMVDKIMSLESGTKAFLLAPLFVIGKVNTKKNFGAQKTRVPKSKG